MQSNHLNRTHFCKLMKLIFFLHDRTQRQRNIVHGHNGGAIIKRAKQYRYDVERTIMYIGIVVAVPPLVVHN